MYGPREAVLAKMNEINQPKPVAQLTEQKTPAAAKENQS
jgi:hypothetical protein